MQTLITLTRDPRRLVAELGARPDDDRFGDRAAALAIFYRAPCP